MPMSPVARRAIKVADAMTVIWQVVEENRRLKEQLARLEGRAKVARRKIKRLGHPPREKKGGMSPNTPPTKLGHGYKVKQF